MLNTFNLSELGCVAWYPLTGHPNDISGNENHGTNNGCTTEKLINGSSCYYFDGSDYIDIPSLSIGTNTWTIFTWVYFINFSDYTHIFTADNQDDFACKVARDSNGKNPYFYTNSTGSLHCDFSLDTGKWYSLVYIYDGDNIIIKVDNNTVLNESVSSLDISSTDFKIGTGNSEYSNVYQQNTMVFFNNLNENQLNHLMKFTSPHYINLINASKHVIGETGRVALSDTIDDGVVKTVTFNNEYENPVIVAYIPTNGGGQSVNFRIRNKTSTDCEIFMEEPDNEGHNDETVCYLVMEEGVHEMFNDIKVEARIHTTSNVHHSPDDFDGDTIEFTENFDSTPTILHSLNTYNNGAFMASVVHDIDTSNFKLQQEAADTGRSASEEDIAWIAMETGNGDHYDIHYEIGRGDDGSKDGNEDSPHRINYSFDSKPDLIVSGNSGNGTDGYWARGDGTWNSSDHDVNAEEDAVGDDERSHANETFGWFAITPDSTIYGYRDNEFYTSKEIQHISPLSFGGTIDGTTPDNDASWEDILDEDGGYLDFDTDAGTSGTRDFGKKVYIEKVRGKGGSSASHADFYIDVSNDNSDWTNIAHWTGGTYRSSPTPYYDVKDKWRYVRIKKSNGGWHDYKLLDIQGYLL